MKITRLFNLGVTQHEVDFVDIDPDGDTRLFLDPFFLGTRTDSWSRSASRTLRNFFQTFVNLIREGQTDRARALFDHLHEPNETCLGLSLGNPQGRAIGAQDADRLFASIVESQAVATGVVEDLEDFRLFIPGIDKDKVSDITTNVIRRHLREYTLNQCQLWGIPTVPNIPTGFGWDAGRRAWVNGFGPALVIDDRRILLTPKGVVSFVHRYTPRKYYQRFVLEYLQHEHLTMGSALVQHRKDGSPYVTKVSLEETVAPYSKEFLSNFTQNHPETFGEFREWVAEGAASLRSDEIAQEEDGAAIARFLIEKLREIRPGNPGATRYHRLCVSILELLLYPALTCPVVELEVNEGRKRIDIVFDNSAHHGVFHRVHAAGGIPAQFVAVECKNYSKEVANPELDQLIGRFTVNTGKVGLLLFRRVDDRALLLARCSDAFVAGQGLILPLTDDDLVELLTGFADGNLGATDRFLSELYRRIAHRVP